MKAEHELRMNLTEMSMIKWICEIKMNERNRSEESNGTNLFEMMRFGG